MSERKSQQLPKLLISSPLTTIHHTATGNTTTDSQSSSKTSFPAESPDATSTFDRFNSTPKLDWMSSFINLLPDAVGLLDKHGNLQLVNSRFASVFELIHYKTNVALSLCSLIHDRDKNEVMRCIDKSYTLRELVSISHIRCFAFNDRETHTTPLELALQFNRNNSDELILLIVK